MLISDSYIFFFFHFTFHKRYLANDIYKSKYITKHERKKIHIYFNIHMHSLKRREFINLKTNRILNLSKKAKFSLHKQI